MSLGRATAVSGTQHADADARPRALLQVCSHHTLVNQYHAGMPPAGHANWHWTRAASFLVGATVFTGALAAYANLTLKDHWPIGGEAAGMALMLARHPRCWWSGRVHCRDCQRH